MFAFCVLGPIWKCTATLFPGQGNNVAVAIYLLFVFYLPYSATLHDCL